MGLPIPEGKDYLVNLLDREQILADINDAKTKADLIILLRFTGEMNTFDIRKKRKSNSRQN